MLLVLSQTVLHDFLWLYPLFHSLQLSHMFWSEAPVLSTLSLSGHCSLPKSAICSDVQAPLDSAECLGNLCEQREKKRGDRKGVERREREGGKRGERKSEGEGEEGEG